MPTAVFDSIQFLNPVKHNYGVLKPFKYIDLAKPKSGASIFIWQSYYSQRKIKIIIIIIIIIIITIFLLGSSITKSGLHRGPNTT